MTQGRGVVRLNAGLTLMELMVAIAIAAVLLVTGLPSLAYVMDVNRVASQTNRLVSALHLARSEAVKRNARVTVCKSPNGTACNAGDDWQNGWIVFIDDGAGGGTADNTLREPGEEIIKLEGAAAGDVSFPGASNFVSFAGDGTSRNSAPVSALASPTLVISLHGESRCLRVGTGGGVTQSKGTGC